MPTTLSKSEENHLRRLLGWISCEIGQSPEELIETVRKISPAFDDLSDEAKQRLVESHEKSASVPKYVRQAVKILEKRLQGTAGDVVDAELAEEGQSLSRSQLPALPDHKDAK